MSVTYYLTATNLDGTAQDKTVENFIEIANLSFSGENSVDPFLDPTLSGVSFDVTDVSALTQFLQNAVNLGANEGRIYESVQIVAISNSAGGPEQVTQIIDLEAAGVSSLSLADASNSASGGFGVSLNYETIHFSTQTYDINGNEDGTIDFGWDVTKQIEIDGSGSTIETASGAVKSSTEMAEYYIYLDGVHGGETVDGVDGYFKLEDYALNLSSLYAPADNNGTGSGGSQAFFSLLSVNLANFGLAPEAFAGVNFAGAEIIGLFDLDGDGDDDVVYDLSIADVRVDQIALSDANLNLGLSFDKISVETTGINSLGQLEANDLFASDLETGKQMNVDVYDGGGSEPVSSMFVGDGITYYLLIDGIVGEVIQSGYKGAIGLDGFDMSYSSPGSGPGTFGPLTLEISNDTTLVNLMSAVSKDISITDASIIGIKGSGKQAEEVLEFDLADVSIASLTDHSNGGYTLELDFEAGRFDVNTTQSNGSTSTQSQIFGDITKSFGDLTESNSSALPVVSFDIDYVINFDGLSGSSVTDPDFKGWSDIEDFTFQTDAGGENAQFTFTMDSDAYAPSQIESYLRGSFVDGIEIAGLHSSSTDPIMTYVFETAEIIELTYSGHQTSITIEVDKYAIKTVGAQTDPLTEITSDFGFDVNKASEVGFETLNGPDDPGFNGFGGTNGYIAIIDGLSGSVTDSDKSGYFDIDGFELDRGDGPFSKASASFSFSSTSEAGLTALMTALATDDLLQGLQIESLLPATGVGISSETYLFNVVKVVSVETNGNGGYTASFVAEKFGTQFEGYDANTGTTEWTNEFAIDNSSKALPFGSLNDKLSTDGGALDVDTRSASTEYFLAIDGLDGSSDEAGYEGSFEITGFDFSLSTQAVIGGSSPAEVTGIDVEMASVADFVQFFEAMTIGALFQDASLVAANSVMVGPAFQFLEIMTLDLTNVRITNVAMVGDDETGSVGFTLVFDTLVMTQSGYDDNGDATDVTTFSWDFDLNMEIDDGGGGGGGGNTPVTDTDTAANSIVENAAIGAAVGITIQADPGTMFTLSDDAGGLFTIDATTGVVTVAGPIDFETTGASVNITVTATYSDGSTQNTVYTIDIGDENKERVFGTDGDDTLFGGPGNDIFRGLDGADILNGGTGKDWAQYVGSDAGVTVDLNSSGPASGGHAQGDILNDIENVRGSNKDDVLTGTNGRNELVGDKGDDTIHGGGDNDVVRGGQGADALFGGDGNDWLQYNGSNAGVTVDLTDTGAGQSVSGGDATGDTVSGFENVRGSKQDDTLTGNDDRNNIIGDAGNDTMSGGGGKDKLDGGAGSDSMDGGSGSAWVQYAGSDAGVSVDLNSTEAGQIATGGHATGDTLTGFENVLGSKFDDVLTGDTANNILIGDKGDDTIYGGDGKDVIRGGQGADTLDGGDGEDWLQYNGSSDAVFVYLDVGDGTQFAVGGDADGDVISGFENIRGSKYGDTLIGDASSNTLNGDRGADYISGGGGGDVLIGGGGADTFAFNLALDGELAPADLDHIADFTTNTDVLEFEYLVFPLLDEGVLDASQFVIGTAAANAGSTTAMVVYDDLADILYFTDGSGSIAGFTALASFSDGTVITASDIFVTIADEGIA